MATFLLLRQDRVVLASIIFIATPSSAVIGYDLHSERLHEERLLARLALLHNEPIYAAPSVVRGARFLIQIRPVTNRVKDAPS